MPTHTAGFMTHGSPAPVSLILTHAPFSFRTVDDDMMTADMRKIKLMKWKKVRVCCSIHAWGRRCPLAHLRAFQLIRLNHTREQEREMQARVEATKRLQPFVVPSTNQSLLYRPMSPFLAKKRALGKPLRVSRLQNGATVHHDDDNDDDDDDIADDDDHYEQHGKEAPQHQSSAYATPAATTPTSSAGDENENAKPSPAVNLATIFHSDEHNTSLVADLIANLDFGARQRGIGGPLPAASPAPPRGATAAAAGATITTELTAAQEASVTQDSLVSAIGSESSPLQFVSPFSVLLERTAIPSGCCSPAPLLSRLYLTPYHSLSLHPLSSTEWQYDCGKLSEEARGG